MRSFYLLLFALYAFGLLVQLPLLYEVWQTPFLWNDGQPVPLFTPDAGLHGFYAKSILNGVEYPFDAERFLGFIIAYSVKLFHLPIDWVMLLLPMFVAPFIVVPMMLLAKSFSQIRLGVLASLFALVYIEFYSRTSIGFTDTDIFILIFPLLSLYGMVMFLKEKQLAYVLLSAISLLIFIHIYHSAASIVVLLIAAFATVALLLDYKESTAYQALLLLGLSIIPADFWMVFGVMVVVAGLFHEVNKRVTLTYYYFIIVFCALILIVPFMVDVHYLVARALTYFDKPKYYTIDGLTQTYYFTHALQTVAETQIINFMKVFYPVSILLVMNIISLIGLMLLVKQSRLWLVLFPFVLLGGISFFAGNRFVFYYTPAYAFGVAYVILELSRWLETRYKVERIWLYLSILVIAFSMFYIANVNKKRYVRMLAYNDEKAVLEELADKLDTKSKIVTWWDFGWPLWYFTAKADTLADNGEHGGPDSYLISRMLSESNQIFVANAAKFLANTKDDANAHGYKYVIPYIAQKKNLKQLFDSFYTQNVQAEQDTYIVLHRSMVTIFNTITKFSDYNISDITQNKHSNFTFRYFSFYYPDNIDNNFLQAHSTIDTENGTKSVHDITFVKDQKIVNSYDYDLNSTYHIILDNNEIAYMTDDNVYNSFLFQALLMDNYDRERFEKVGETYLIKIFKVK